MNSKKWAIFCWVFSGLIFMGSTLFIVSKGVFTADMVMDYVLSMAMLVNGFAHWKNGKKEVA